MIQVKENLLKGYKGIHKIKALNNGVASDNYNYRQITIPTSLEENQKYTFCFSFKQFNGSGIFSIMLFDKNNTKSAGSARLNVIDGRFYFNFTYRAGITVNLLIYTDVSGETRGVGAEIKDMIIVDGYFDKNGEEIVYLPHKEDVKPENQAIFPIGGGVRSKRFIHSNLKTSRNRPVKFGGALC